MTKRKVPAAVITSFLLLPLWWTEAVAQSREKVVQILNEQAAKSVTREISSRNVCASYYLCNIADSEAVAQTADRIRRDFGAVDILVNNAGTVVGKSFFDITLEEMQRTMNVNFWGHLFFTKAFIGPDGHLKIPHLWPGQYRLLQRSDRHADAFGICRQ